MVVILPTHPIGLNVPRLAGNTDLNKTTLTSGCVMSLQQHIIKGYYSIKLKQQIRVSGGQLVYNLIDHGKLVFKTVKPFPHFQFMLWLRHSPPRGRCVTQKLKLHYSWAVVRAAETLRIQLMIKFLHVFWLADNFFPKISTKKTLLAKNKLVFCF